MARRTAEQYLKLLQRSGLVDDTALRTIAAEFRAAPKIAALPAEHAIEALGQRLIDQRLLTPWQHQRLAAGRYRGFILGKYKLLAHLGTGGMSRVYLAEHTRMRRQVALKVLPHEKVRDRSYLERFYREAQAVAGLDHPNIVRAYNIDNDGDTHFLVMEYVSGQDLEKLVEINGPLPCDRAADYIAQAAAGLEHAHGRGMIHRDIKPSNLLVDGSGTVRILDLGLALLVDEVRSLTMEYRENTLGTTDYMAPEQAIDSHQVDARADIYSLGCTLYFVLSGRPPFPEGTLTERLLKHQQQEPTPVEHLRTDVPRWLIDITRRMMEKQPSQRFSNAGEVLQALLTRQAPALALAAPVPERALVTASPGLAHDLGMPQTSALALGGGGSAVGSSLELAFPEMVDDSEFGAGATVAHSPRSAPHSRKFMLLAAGVTAAVVLLGMGWSLSNQGASGQQTASAAGDTTLPPGAVQGAGLIVVDWLPGDRSGGTLEVAGKNVPVPPSGPLELNLETGSYHLELRRPGYMPNIRVVKVQPGKRKHVATWWTRVEQAPAASSGGGSAARWAPVLSFQTDDGRVIAFYRDWHAWRQQTAGVVEFPFSPHNVSLANGISRSQADAGELPSRLIWAQDNTAARRAFSVAALQPGASLQLVDYDRDGRAGELNIGTPPHEDDDWEFVVREGEPAFALGCFMVGNGPRAGESLQVFDRSNRLLATLGSEYLPHNDPNGFLGVISEIPLGRLYYDEDPDGDGVGLAKVVFGAAPVKLADEPNLQYVSPLGSRVEFFRDRATWEARVENVAKFPFSLANVGLARQLGSLPKSGARVGTLLQWSAATPGVPREFGLRALQPGTNLLASAAGNIGTEHLWIGNGEFEDDDWELRVPPQPPLKACSFQLVHSNGTRGETLTLYGADDVLLARLPGDYLPANGDDQFLGMISVAPICRLHYDEDDGTDDIGLAEVQFADPRR